MADKKEEPAKVPPYQGDVITNDNPTGKRTPIVEVDAFNQPVTSKSKKEG